MKMSSFLVTEENSCKNRNLYEYFVTNKPIKRMVRKLWVRNVKKYVKENKWDGGNSISEVK